MKHSLSITVPALNEEENLQQAVESMVQDFRKYDTDWELVIIDDGSTDATPRIAEDLCRQYQGRIKVIHHATAQGIGASMWAGFLASSKDAVTWLPGDGENDPGEIIKYLPLLEHVDFIIPFVINRDVRSQKRQLLSRIFTMIVNATFGTFFNYTNGNVIYKRAIFERFRPESSGFFFQAECIIKSMRQGFLFAEVPVRLRKRQKGESKAMNLKTLKVIARDYFRLIWSVYFRTPGTSGSR